jgi:hypothetical protein
LQTSVTHSSSLHNCTARSWRRHISCGKLSRGKTPPELAVPVHIDVATGRQCTAIANCIEGRTVCTTWVAQVRVLSVLFTPCTCTQRTVYAFVRCVHWVRMDLVTWLHTHLAGASRTRLDLTPRAGICTTLAHGRSPFQLPAQADGRLPDRLFVQFWRRLWRLAHINVQNSVLATSATYKYAYKASTYRKRTAY